MAVPIIETRGARISYLVEGNGPPVLLVQGAGLVGEGWRPQIDGLGDRFTLVTFDNQGIGASTLPPGRRTIEDMAQMPWRWSTRWGLSGSTSQDTRWAASSHRKLR